MLLPTLGLLELVVSVESLVIGLERVLGEGSPCDMSSLVRLMG